MFETVTVTLEIRENREGKWNIFIFELVLEDMKSVYENILNFIFSQIFFLKYFGFT